MNRQDLMAILQKGFRTYRATVWFRVTYLVVLGLLAAQLTILTASPLACLFVLLIPITTFIVPYWLGERKIRRFAVNAIPVFVIAILVAAAMSTQALISQGQPAPLHNEPSFRSAAGLNLSEGEVTPYRGAPPGPFTFRVKLTTAASSVPGNFNVSLNLTIIRGVGVTGRPSFAMAFDPANATSDTRDGVVFELTRDLDDSIYGFGFSVTDGRNWTEAGPDFGPLTASGWAYYGFFLYFTGLSLVFFSAFIVYYTLLFLWWFTLRSREVRAKYGIPGVRGAPARGPGSGKDLGTGDATKGPKAVKAAGFTCTNCGADVSAGDTKCPKCGATFED